MGKLKFIFVFLTFVAGLSAQAQPYSILQGVTSETIAQFTVVAPATDSVSFQIQEPNGRLTTLSSSRATYPGSQYVVYKMRAADLHLNTDYKLQVLKNGSIADQRLFTTLDTKKRDGRLAFGSCMVRQLHNPFLWNHLAEPENRPDVLMIIGDVVYLDRPSAWPAHKPENGLEVWEEFVKARLKENLYFWDRLIPMITIWDDHDSGGDNVNSRQSLMPETRRIYETFFANEEIPGFLEHGPGMAKAFSLFGKNFILLDGRSWRNASASHPLFGPEQDRWLLQKVQTGPNFIVSGSQFYGGALKKDSLEYNWPEFAKEWTQILREHGQWKRASFAFLSGDVHFSEVMDLEPALYGYRTVEITSSNLHSFGAPGHYLLKPANPRRRVVTGTHNIVLLEFSAADAGFGFVARSMGWRGNDLFKTVISVGSSFSPAASSNAKEPTKCESPLSAVDNSRS